MLPVWACLMQGRRLFVRLRAPCLTCASSSRQRSVKDANWRTCRHCFLPTLQPWLSALCLSPSTAALTEADKRKLSCGAELRPIQGHSSPWTMSRDSVRSSVRNYRDADRGQFSKPLVAVLANEHSLNEQCVFNLAGLKAEASSLKRRCLPVRRWPSGTKQSWLPSAFRARRRRDPSWQP